DLRAAEGQGETLQEDAGGEDQREADHRGLVGALARAAALAPEGRRLGRDEIVQAVRAGPAGAPRLEASAKEKSAGPKTGALLAADQNQRSLTMITSPGASWAFSVAFCGAAASWPRTTSIESFCAR